jgi:hypothetical protein
MLQNGRHTSSNIPRDTSEGVAFPAAVVANQPLNKERITKTEHFGCGRTAVLRYDVDSVNGSGVFCCYVHYLLSVRFDVDALRMLRIVSGWSTARANAVYLTGLTITDDDDALGVGLPDSLLRRSPFAVAVKRAILADSFATPSPEDPGVPDGWYNWKPAADPGAFIYDHAYGRRDTHAVCLDTTQNAVWQRKLPIRTGGTYRFSGWVRAEKASANGRIGRGELAPGACRP